MPFGIGGDLRLERLEFLVVPAVFVADLHASPEASAEAQVSAQNGISPGGDPPLALQNQTHLILTERGLLAELIDTDPQGIEELLLEDGPGGQRFSGADGRHGEEGR
jgi:hypothetical protein